MTPEWHPLARVGQVGECTVRLIARYGSSVLTPLEFDSFVLSLPLPPISLSERDSLFFSF